MIDDLPARIRARFARRFGSPAAQEGAVAPFMVLALIGGLVAAGFAIDALRMTSDAGQLKRATDAAALALGREFIRNVKDFDAVGTGLAGDYVRANLGVGSDLKETLQDVSLTRTAAGGNTILEVVARFSSQPVVSGNAARDITIRSAVEVHVGSVEVALVVPFLFDMSPEAMAALTRLSWNFAGALLRDDGHVALSIVPYSQRVNVYDPKRSGRVRTWARPEGLKPKELAIVPPAPRGARVPPSNFFDQTGIADLASPETPDLQSGRACLRRGLDLGENYFWDQPPASQFYISYLIDYPGNSPPGYYPYVEFMAQNLSGFRPGACPPSYSTTFLTMFADKGCPLAPVLPQTRDRQAIAEHLRSFRKAHVTAPGRAVTVNYGFALGWGAMTLAPNFRGEGGWGGDPALPMDFDTGTNDRQKAIVMLVTIPKGSIGTPSDANSSVQYNDCRETLGKNTSDLPARYASLCDSFRKRHIRTFLLVNETPRLTSGSPKGSSEIGVFQDLIGNKLLGCAENPADFSYFPGTSFADVEASLQGRLNDIAEELQKRGSFVRLIR